MSLPARAADTFHTDGATLSLVAAPPGPDGKLRAALRVDLAPGWKTYWLDPGDAGIPPVLSFEGSRAVTDPKTIFPAPVRFEEGDGGSSIGYVAPFSIAIEAEARPSTSPALHLRVTLGLCRELCVPVVADLSVDPSTAGDEAEVRDAFADLPRPSGPDGGILALRLAADKKELEVAVKPAELAASADVFVAAPGWVFGAPVAGKDGQIALPVLRKPRKPGPLPEAEAVLTTKAGSFRATATITDIGG